MPESGKNNAPTTSSALVLEEINEDYLITYREFMTALRAMKDNLSPYKSLLPRTLSFHDVLKSHPVEKTYEISDVAIDDFYMFRYEMNTIFQKHLFQDEQKSDFLLGKKPLSNIQGVPVKEVIESLKKNKDSYKTKMAEYEDFNKKCQEIYVPPGVIKTKYSRFEKDYKVSNDIRLATPSDKIQMRMSGKKFTSSMSSKPEMSRSSIKQSTTSAAAGKKDKDVAKARLEIERRELADLARRELEVQVQAIEANDFEFQTVF